MRAVMLIVALVAGVSGERDLGTYTFEKWCSEFGKNFTEAEIPLRKEIFRLRVANIRAHNSDPNKAWTESVNQFTGLTAAEFKAMMGRSKGLGGLSSTFLRKGPHSYSEALPASVDWRNKGVITPVKNQGSCGSCWAFASTETLESHISLDTGKLLTLSPQNLVSCDPNTEHCGGTGGCGGSIAELAFKFVMENGIALESAYPYTSGSTGQTGKCKPTPPAAKVTNFVKLIENNYTDVMVALATVGPLAVNVFAEPWQSYSSGVYSGCGQSGNIDIDHVVQLVGYGTDPRQGDYWIIRNSWGTSWGEDGYMRLKRHSGTAFCAKDSTPADGTGCSGGPPEVTVCGECGVLYDASYPTGGSLI